MARASEAVNQCSRYGTWRNPPKVLKTNTPVILENKISCIVRVHSLTVVCTYFTLPPSSIYLLCHLAKKSRVVSQLPSFLTMF
jgi:hypothetical protein